MSRLLDVVNNVKRERQLLRNGDTPSNFSKEKDVNICSDLS